MKNRVAKAVKRNNLSLVKDEADMKNFKSPGLWAVIEDGKLKQIKSNPPKTYKWIQAMIKAKLLFGLRIVP